jgi:phage shock protein PspC (stress-responsive transcriptional regulator)
MATPPTPPDPPEEPVTAPTEPVPGPPEPRRLSRSSSDRVLGGVAGGLGRYFDIDPIIFRIGFVVLALAGGAGFLAYGAAWLFVPADPDGGAAPAGRNRVLTYVGAGLVAIAALISLGHGLFVIAPPLFGLGLIALLGVALWRVAESRGGDGGRALRRAGLAILLLVVAGVGFIAVAVGSAAGGGAVFAGLVIAIGAALAVSAFLGGEVRWLVIPALVIAIPLGFVAASGIDVKGGVGDRDYRPTSLAEVKQGYRLGVGALRVDMRNVDLPAGRTPLKLRVGIGSVRVLVPADVCIDSHMRVAAGYARVLERDSAGLDVDWSNRPLEIAGTKRLVIAGKVGIGEIQVAHNASEFDQHDRRAGFNPPLSDSIQDDPACRAAA